MTRHDSFPSVARPAPLPLARSGHITTRALGRLMLLATVLLAGGGQAVAQPDSDAASPSFSPIEQFALARAFAPVFLLHPDEAYLPVAPTFPEPFGTTPEGTSPTDTPTAARSARDRAGLYDALSREDRLRAAAVGYRVYPVRRHGRSQVVVEYWCHYVFNAFTIHVPWLPHSLPGNHLQDLERLFVVLDEDPAEAYLRAGDRESWVRAAFTVSRIVANAHTGGVPPNLYDTEVGGPVALPLAVLVERGSHAMAPDVDHDGRFTPGVDGTPTGKLLWGIRDDGRLWGWTRRSATPERDPASGLRLCHGPVDDAACAPYALYPVDRVQRWFAALDLPKQDRLALTGRTSLFWKVFSDVRVEDLLVAHDPPDGLALDSMLNRRRRASQGIFAGSTSVSGAPALVMGVSRYWDVTSRRWPDLGVEGNFVLPSGRRGIPELLLFGSYPVDATVNAFAGVSLTSNRNTNADILLGTDIRVGIVRVRPFRRIRDGVTGARIAVAF